MRYLLEDLDVALSRVMARHGIIVMSCLLFTLALLLATAPW